MSQTREIACPACRRTHIVPYHYNARVHCVCGRVLGAANSPKLSPAESALERKFQELRSAFENKVSAYARYERPPIKFLDNDDLFRLLEPLGKIDRKELPWDEEVGVHTATVMARFDQGFAAMPVAARVQTVSRWLHDLEEAHRDRFNQRRRMDQLFKIGLILGVLLVGTMMCLARAGYLPPVVTVVVVVTFFIVLLILHGM